MKKRIVTIMAAMLTLAVLLCGCGQTQTFSGSKTGDEEHFDIDFEALNTSFSHELVMEEGEYFNVSIEAAAGNIALTIQCEENDPVYTGNHLQTGDFKVGADRAGTYTITVTGEKAKGHVVVKK